ncbi:MAG: hypothetical protein NXI31_00600 [bacterium]|nr:hypothetical protein [bacterium]
MRTVAIALLILAAPTRAQDGDGPDPPWLEPAVQVAARVEAGGVFQESRWRRGRDGQLEVWNIARTGEEIPGHDHFVPLFADGFVHDYRKHGRRGLAMLLCHGPGDLLAMTDARFHFAALGIDASDMGLRQFLARALPGIAELEPESDRDRARLLDIELAISTLERRGVRGAIAECLAIEGIQAAPPTLRTRARQAVASLRGKPTTRVRRRLDATTLRLPLNFDAAIVVDHSRLPDMTWLAPLSRRFAAVSMARRILQAGGTLSPAQKNGAQILSDAGSELPFAFVHRYGNARFDHSCIVVQGRADEVNPFAITWQAAGEIEPHQREIGEATERQQKRRPKLLNGDIEFSEHGLLATSGMGAGKPRPERGAELLRDRAAAIHVVVPRQSKLWPFLRFAQLPTILGAELRVTFDTKGAQIAGEVMARDEEDAAELCPLLEGILATIAPAACLPWELREDEGALALAKALLTAELTNDGAAVRVKARIPVIDAAERERLAMLFVR